MAELSEHQFASSLRGKIFTGLIIGIFTILTFRFVQLQIVEGQSLSGAAIEQGLKKLEVTPVRGTLYDRHGRIVAASVPAYTVAVTPQDFTANRDIAMPMLTRILGVDSNFIMKKVSQGGFYTRFQPIKIYRDANPRIIAAIEENLDKLPGVDIIVESKRNFIAPVRAAHLIGYTKEISPGMLDRVAKTSDSDYYHPGDVVGTTGLEAVYEPQLRGMKGFEFIAVDARGQRQSRLNEGRTDINAVDGSNVQLGMDIDIQEYAEQLMDEHRGAVVALDPNTGDIIALVSKPDFDLDLFSGKTSKAEYQSVLLDPAHPLFNRALQTRYPPGSTWKLMMASSILQTKTIPFDYTINCPGYFTYGNHTYKDDAVHGHTDITSSIVRSCNAFYFRMSLMLGINRMRQFSHYFGFDSATGVDIGHEGNGFIPDVKRMDKLYPGGWTNGYIVSQGIGQGEIGVTPIQQAAYAATWANRGLWVQPHAVKRILNGKTGKWDSVVYKTHRVPIADTIIELVRNAMLGVVNGPGGTGHGAQIPNAPFQIAGKTGTAQNPHGKDHAWFICFAPFDKPKIALCVMVENAGFGGVVAAPIARKLINLYLTGTREDPEPEILPNTPAYEKYKAAKYGSGGVKVNTPVSPKKPAPAKPTPASPSAANRDMIDRRRG